MARFLKVLAFGLTAGLLFAAIGCERAAALGFEAFGPAGEHIGRSPDWPEGVEVLLLNPSRVYWRDVNGSEWAYYDGDTQAINNLLEEYSRIDIREHPVVIRPGRPSAKSFDGKETPYVVEFEIPGSLFLHSAGALANSGLYATAPRMIVHLDAQLADRIDKLKIPKNVTLYKLSTRVEDALAHVDDKDAGLRHRALVALGEAGDDSTECSAALKRAAADEDPKIRRAAETAFAEIKASQEPVNSALRRKIHEFVHGHPQRKRKLEPQAVLEALRKADKEYSQGFTARGTRVEPLPSGAGRLVAWTLTMGHDQIVVEECDVEDADHPRAAGRSEYTHYVGPERMGSLHGNRVWNDGKLIDAKPQATFEPVGSTYDLLIGRILWPLGRGFSRRIDHITSVVERPDGLLDVKATGDGSLVERWELVVDPAADYLVRSAKGFDRRDVEPSYAVEAGGVLEGGGRSVAHTSRWIDGRVGSPASIAVTSVSSTIDEELIQRTKDRLDMIYDFRIPRPR